MAKDKGKPAKADKVEAKAEKAAEREFKFGVEELAEKLGIKAASVRVQLRNKGVDKAGKSYGWNTKAELQEVVDTIRAEADEKPAAKKAKPAAKAKKAKPAAKGKKKPADDDDD